MNRLMITVVAAGTILTAAPAFAQGIDVGVGNGGVSVGVGRDYDRDWDRGRHHDWDRRHYGWNRGDCRDVTVQRRLPDGSMVTRSRRECD
jgi:hypothetical protein